ncbi:effector-associated constant component EACC1 [Streptomyces cinerochromogenes]|uniref:effector-associated constant component EACC1 n=1 Tax=Streptomyces cinerochromogenes TaxID=66422 RepID=UPI0033BE3FE2
MTSQQLRIRTESGSGETGHGFDELASLFDWLRREDALRGRVRVEHAPIARGEMGGGLDALVVAIGPGGVGAAAVGALIGALAAWFQHRRADLRITVTNENGRTVEVDGKRVDVPVLVEVVGRLLADGETGGDGEAGGDGAGAPE